MKKTLIAFIALMPTLLWSQIDITAYKTTNTNKEDIIRIKVRNTGNSSIQIRNGSHFNEFSTNGTFFYFMTTQENKLNKKSDIAYFGFYPKPLKFDKNIFIKKGETISMDIPLAQIIKEIPDDKKIHLLGTINWVLCASKKMQYKNVDILITI